MTHYAIWFLVSFLLLILELVTGTFYVLMLALAFAAGGIAALLGLGLPLQFLIAAVVGVIASLLLRRSKLGGTVIRKDASVDPLQSLDIGQTVEVKEWTNSSSRVTYRGSQWDAVLAADEAEVPGSFFITEVRGTRLTLSKRKPNHV